MPRRRQRGGRRPRSGSATARRSPTARSCVFLASREYAEKYAQGSAASSSRPDPAHQGLGPPHRAPALRRQGRREQGRPSTCSRTCAHDHRRLEARRHRRRARHRRIETHDCFTTSEYMAIDHFGITEPGESWKAVEEGWLDIDGKHPINPSGGLIGAGHPVGATGVRQLLDATCRSPARRRLPGRGREALPDAEHRRQRHDQRELHRRRVTVGWANCAHRMWLLAVGGASLRTVRRSACRAPRPRSRSRSPFSPAPVRRPHRLRRRVRSRIERVDDARLRAAASEPAELAHLRRQLRRAALQPLAQIDASNVAAARPRLVLRHRAAARPRGDAARGRRRDLHDRLLERRVRGRRAHRASSSGATTRRCRARRPGIACCDVVNRGVAVYRGRVYAATLDGRLQALDAKTGKPRLVGGDRRPERARTRSRWRRACEGEGDHRQRRRRARRARLRLGLRRRDRRAGLALLHGARRSVAAVRDARAREGREDLGPGGEYWKVGGGGTVWDAVAFDPELDLLYVGTGNGSPWSRTSAARRAATTCIVCSILALRPDTGQLVWHYQTTPGDNWDFTSTQHILLADLDDRRAAAQGAAAGAEERLLLRARPRDRRADLRRAVRDGDLGRAASTRRPGARSSAGASTIARTPSRSSPRRSARTTGSRCRSTRRRVSSTSRRTTSPGSSGSTRSSSTARAPGTSATTSRSPTHFRASSSRGTCSRGIRSRRRRSGARSTWARGTAARSRPPGTSSSRAPRTAPSPPIARATASRSGRQPAGTGIVAAPVTYELDGDAVRRRDGGLGRRVRARGRRRGRRRGRAPRTNFGRLLVYRLGGTATLPAPAGGSRRALAALPTQFDAALVDARQQDLSRAGARGVTASAR